MKEKLLYVRNVTKNLKVAIFIVYTVIVRKLTKKKKIACCNGKCKGCFQPCTKHNCCGFQGNNNIEKQIVFKTTDYDLNRDERKVKFKGYDLIICGECKRKFDYYRIYCVYYFYKMTNINKKNCILYGNWKM